MKNNCCEPICMHNKSWNTCEECRPNLNQNKVNPEGVGDSNTLLRIKSWSPETYQEVVNLLLQEKAKWKGELKKEIEKRMCLLSQVDIAERATKSIKYTRDEFAIGKVYGFDEVCILIDNL